MPYVFHVHQESLRRKFAVYVVVARAEGVTDLYVGKAGDNREGCNPLISQCGNHFSYNNIHSQVRNKIVDHEMRDYTYVFDHFDDYTHELVERRTAIDRINEMERWLNQEKQRAITGRPCLRLINPHKGTGYISAKERKKRESFRTPDARLRIEAIAAAALEVCG